MTTRPSFDPKRKTRHLTAWLTAGACGVVACAAYENPEKLVGEDPVFDTGGTAGAGVGGSVGQGSAAGSTTTTSAGTSPSPSAGSSGAGSSGGASAAGSGGSGGAVADGGGGEGGAPGSGASACPDCVALQAALEHRYDFDGTGTAVMDRVGDKHGSVVGGAVLSGAPGKGVVVLEGGNAGSYVDLPNGLVSSLSSATFEAWVSWAGGMSWQRIFDFGDSNSPSPEDAPADGKSYLFLTPMTDPNSGGLMRLVYSLQGGAATVETRVEAPSSLLLGLTQLVVVVDAVGGELQLFQDGKAVAGEPFTGALGSLNDVNCWLGRSQYAADPELAATFHDFRIYDAALTPSQIAASFAGGPDPAFLSE